MSKRNKLREMTYKELHSLGSSRELVCGDCGTRQFQVISPPARFMDDWFDGVCIMNNRLLVCIGKLTEVSGSWKLLKEDGK